MKTTTQYKLVALALLLGLTGCNSDSFDTNTRSNIEHGKDSNLTVQHRQPTPPVLNLSAKAAISTISLSWAIAADANAEYRVYWSENGKNPDQDSAFVDVYRPPYTHYNVTPGHTYQFRVSVWRNGVESSLSNTLSITQPTEILPTARPSGNEAAE